MNSYEQKEEYEQAIRIVEKCLKWIEEKNK